MEINYFGNIALTKAVLPIFQKQQSGSIVIISSLSGKFGFFLRSAYAASKFALVGFYESLRLEEEKNNLNVHLVFPGFIKTNISQNALNSEGKSHKQLDDNQNKGISPEECAARLIKGIQKNRRNIFIGGKEMTALKIQRFFPNLFYKIIKKQKAT
jgi:short-subunit dehydrogenase